jgi:hypothetical protein
MLETSLLKDTIQRARRHFNSEFAGNRHGTRFYGMLILAAASLRSNVLPPDLLKHANHITKFHCGLLLSMGRWLV